MDMDKIILKVSPRRIYDAIMQCLGGACLICGDIPTKMISYDAEILN
jgi:pyruvate/2-oxoglutarate dehydrogenase complex dihydrolipoamide dehydrogenase (E3) component